MWVRVIIVEGGGWEFIDLWRLLFFYYLFRENWGILGFYLGEGGLKRRLVWCLLDKWIIGGVMGIFVVVVRVSLG